MFLLKFLAATAVMKLIDWFTNAENIGKVKSIFRFIKDNTFQTLERRLVP